MGEKIGGRPLGASGAAPRPLGADGTESSASRNPELSGPKDHPVRDGFERQGGGLSGAQLKQSLQALASRGASGKVQFSNEDMAYLATTFAALLRQHPKANRAKRAKLFAKAILKGHKKLSKLLQKVPEQDAEAMFDAVANALDSSPVFAQMVENVTEEAGKLNG
jgi:hypothetical protein